MSADGFLRNVQGISNLTQGAVDLLGRLTGGSFWSQLQPASYRGVPFGVLGGQARFGRRNALHEYPFRDTVWVEDLGKAARRVQLSGFLVGDDAIAQRARLIAACEKKGDGELIHPTLGRLTVALMDVSTSEHWDHGRVFEIAFSFIEQGKRLYPETATSTAATVTSAADGADAAASQTFVSRAIAALKSGAAVANESATVAAAWSKKAIQAGNDATSLLQLAVSLPGEFGRLLGQASGVGQIVPVQPGLTVQGLTGKAAVARQAVAVSAVGLATTAGNLSVTSASPFAAAGQNLVASVLSASPTPGDALRGLSKLADFALSSTSTGVYLAMHAATIDLFRRTAAIAMARAAADYQPSSNDDAAAARNDVLARLDAEITSAGDQGDDDAFTSLRALRSAVVKDMNAKGAGLPTLTTVKTARPTTSLALAQRLYRDPTRAEELVGRANPIHPAFMPTTFQALNA